MGSSAISARTRSKTESVRHEEVLSDSEYFTGPLYHGVPSPESCIDSPPSAHEPLQHLTALASPEIPITMHDDTNTTDVKALIHRVESDMPEDQLGATSALLPHHVLSGIRDQPSSTVCKAHTSEDSASVSLSQLDEPELPAEPEHSVPSGDQRIPLPLLQSWVLEMKRAQITRSRVHL